MDKSAIVLSRIGTNSEEDLLANTNKNTGIW